MVEVRADHLRAALLFACEMEDSAVELEITERSTLTIAAAAVHHMAFVELAPWSGSGPNRVRISRPDALDLANALTDAGALGVAVELVQGLGVTLSWVGTFIGAGDAGPGKLPTGLAAIASEPPSVPTSQILTAPLDLALLGRMAPHFEALCPCNIESNPGQFVIRPGCRAVVILGGRDHEILNVTYIINTELPK